MALRRTDRRHDPLADPRDDRLLHRSTDELVEVRADGHAGPHLQLHAVLRDGVELKIRARVIVRTNISQLIGGATEETIIARVGEGIITSIGSAESHFDVMEHPDTISKAVLHRGLDAQTAFQIVSIDIADIEVGENIGARLQADQAEADTRVARAKAEERRSIAIAREQEMKASTAENRARVLQSEALVPKAMGEAFRAGRLESIGPRSGVPAPA